MKKYISNIFIIVFLFACSSVSHAGMWSRVSTAFSSFVGAVKAGAIGADDEAGPDIMADDGGADSDVPGDAADDSTVTAAADEGMCRVPQQQPELICEIGSGFLCVSTPDAGVAADYVIVRGTVDRRSSVVTAMSVAVQHEYTKETIFIDTSSPATSNCKTGDAGGSPFCLDEEGYFAARVPLPELGPYTVSVAASRLSGDLAEKSVRLSRVRAPELKSGSIAFDPDISTGSIVESDVLNVVVNLIGDCQFCDFIGASTGGVTVTVDNTITGSDGAVRHVSCSTNVEQGGQGRFVIGVPVGAGGNSLAVSVCNAAVAGECPSLGGIAFSGPVAVGGMEVLSPDALPAYDAHAYPSIDWSFRLGGMEPDACVFAQLNRESIREVCASGGVYRTTLNPVAGINVVTVDAGEGAGKRTYPWTFGWGAINSPFGDARGIAHSLTASKAIQLAIPSHTLTGVLEPLVSNALMSDAFGDFLDAVLAAPPPTREFPSEESDGGVSEDTSSIEEIKQTLPGCASGGGMMEGSRIELVGRPSIGSARIEDMRLEKDRFSFAVNADDIDVSIRLVTDADDDGVPEGDPLPLRIAFRKAVFDVSMEIGSDVSGRRAFFVSSDHTDCDYKSRRYCTGTPAVLVPDNFVGAATAYGGFVKCDAAGQTVSRATRELCASLNSLNAQTAVMSEKTLDALNGTVYCTGSAYLTNMLRGGSGDALRIGCFSDDPEDREGAVMGCTAGTVGELLGPWLLSAAFDASEGLVISPEGIFATADLRVGSRELFGEIEDRLQDASVGVVVDPRSDAAHRPLSSARTDRLVKIALGVDALNHLLFLTTHQSFDGEPSGLLDIDFDEVIIGRWGFDFVQQCDAFEVSAGSEKKPSSLCTMRPRVGELLGSALSTYRYFQPNQPLRMRLRGNRALSPHIKLVGLEDLPVVSRVEGVDETTSSSEDIPGGVLLDVQLGGITLSFYALEIDEDAPLDEYGNLPILLGNDGMPIIRSMRPDDSDPGKGQIISFEMTLLLALEINGPVSDPEDPTRLIMTLRPLAGRSRLVLTPAAGSNATTVPSESLVSALREKLTYAIAIFSAADKAIKIPIPKEFTFAAAHREPDSIVHLLGLSELVVGHDGLELVGDEESAFITVDVGGVIRQITLRDGISREDSFPR